MRIWAPSSYYHLRGSLVNVGIGMGSVFDSQRRFLGERYMQKTHEGEVRVIARPITSPDYDSGWFDIQATERWESQRRLQHNLDGTPARYRVLVRAIDGPNAGMVFESRADGSTRDHYTREYGGVVAMADPDEIFVFVASRWDASDSYCIHIGTGYGNNHALQSSQFCQVRVQAWGAQRTQVPIITTEWQDASLISGRDLFDEIRIP